jgi:hypothetical protein
LHSLLMRGIIQFLVCRGDVMDETHVLDSTEEKGG